LGMAAAAVALWIVVDCLVAVCFRKSDPMTFYLVRVLIGWGSLLALGAALAPGHQRLLAGVIVFTVTGAFVGLWIAALASRRAKMG
jgi:hypothetical protein